MKGRRPPAGPPEFLNFRGWSVTTWIIVICVGVFVLDSFLPMRLVPMEWRLLEEVADVDRSRLVISELGAARAYGLSEHYVTIPGHPNEPVGTVLMQHMHFLESYLHFSTGRGFLQVEFWRLIGFQFLHSHVVIVHLLFNMIGLFFFGPLAEGYLGKKRYLAFYLLCGIFGALTYCLLNLLGFASTQLFGASVNIPGLLFNNINTPLVGASAGVFGVILAGAYLAPHAKVYWFFFLPIRLRTLAYLLVGLSFVTILTAGNNAGGEAAHIGGALAGMYFIRHPRHLHGFFDVLGRADPTSHHYRNRPGKPGVARKPSDREIDRILDKVNREGVHSLNAREKKILRDASAR